MMHVFFVLLILVQHAYSDYCMSYDFEDERFNDLFSKQSIVCNSAVDVWKIGSYDEINLRSPHPLSTKFIYPGVQFSCTRSWSFLVTPLGVVEVNIYMDTSNPFEQVYVTVIGGWFVDIDIVVGQGTIQAVTPGWHTLRVDISDPIQPLGQTGPFQGHIAIMSTAAESSVILVDSFRHIPPGMDEEDCKLYAIENTSTESTTGSTTEITTESITEITTEIINESTTEIINVSTSTESIVEDTTESETQTTVESTTNISVESTIIITSEAAYGSTTKEPVDSTTVDASPITEENTNETTVKSTTESYFESPQTTLLPTRPPLIGSVKYRFFIILAFLALLLLFILIAIAMCICSRRQIVNNNNNHITITQHPKHPTV